MYACTMMLAALKISRGKAPTSRRGWLRRSTATAAAAPQSLEATPCCCWQPRGPCSRHARLVSCCSPGSTPGWREGLMEVMRVSRWQGSWPRSTPCDTSRPPRTCSRARRLGAQRPPAAPRLCCSSSLRRSGSTGPARRLCLRSACHPVPSQAILQSHHTSLLPPSALRWQRLRPTLPLLQAVPQSSSLACPPQAVLMLRLS